MTTRATRCAGCCAPREGRGWASGITSCRTSWPATSRSTTACWSRASTRTAPAAKAGVKAGDVIVKLNGRKVADASDLGEEVARIEPGQEATLTVQREGRPVDLKVTVAGAPVAARPARSLDVATTRSHRAHREHRETTQNTSVCSVHSVAVVSLRGLRLVVELHHQARRADRQGGDQQQVRERDQQQHQAGDAEAEALGPEAPVPPRRALNARPRRVSAGSVCCSASACAPHSRPDRRAHERDQAERAARPARRPGSRAKPSAASR